MTEPELEAALTRARAKWPGVAVAPERFAAAIAERVGEGELAGLALEDLYLACGCSDGDAAALAAFDRAYAATIEHALIASGAARGDLADLGQVVRQRLLVAPAGEAPPRIASYSARGALGSWVRVVATREGSRALSRVAREYQAGDDQLATLIAPDDDPEVGYLKRLYRDEFKRAFAAAVDALDDRDRLLLRQRALDGLSIDQLAALHAIHRATAARWVEAAREAVLAATQRELIARLELSSTELASVMRLIRSQLDLSLPRILAR